MPITALDASMKSWKIVGKLLRNIFLSVLEWKKGAEQADNTCLSVPVKENQPDCPEEHEDMGEVSHSYLHWWHREASCIICV